MSRLQELESELQAIMKEGFTSAEAYEHFEAVRAECRQLAFDQRSQGGDFAGALMLCDSQEVAGSIVRLAPLMTDNTLRDILRSEWPRCEAHKPYRREMVELFKRVGFVQDGEINFPKQIIVYRGNLGEEEPSGISWTLEQETAERFSTWSQSARAAFLGIDTRGTPTVWQGTVGRDDILAYFTRRGEEEVVLDPATIRNVRQVG